MLMLICLRYLLRQLRRVAAAYAMRKRVERAIHSCAALLRGRDDDTIFPRGASRYVVARHD